MDFGNWESAIQKWAGQGIDAVIAKKVTQPYEVERLKMQTYGASGFFNDGQSGIYDPATGQMMQQKSQMPMVLMLAGAGVVAFILLKD